MPNELKNVLVIAGAEAVARVRDALSLRGIVSTHVPGAAHAFAAAAAARVHLVVVAHGPAAAETCRAIREISIPALLLTNATAVLEVNALRKAANASLALTATSSDADLAAAAASLIGQTVAIPPATLTPEPPITGYDRDPAWTIATACRERWNGNLRIGERGLLLLEGEPIAASSNLPGERLGELLVKKNRATPDQVERALKIAQKKGTRIGATLVDMSVVTAAEIEATVAEQNIVRALAMFGPPTGPTKFTSQKAIRPDERRMSGVLTAVLVTEGIRRLYDATRFKALIPDASVFKFVPGAAARFPEFRFTPAEAASLAHVDGKRTVGEILARTSPLDFLHALYAGACMDLLRGA